MYNNSTDFKVTLLNVNFVLRFWNLKCFYSKPERRGAYLISDSGPLSDVKKTVLDTNLIYAQI